MKLRVKSSHGFISKSMRIPTLTKISWWIIQLILLGHALSKASSERTKEDEREDSEYSDPIEEYPTVNKCCPLDQRYEQGKCVKANPRDKDGQTLEVNWRPPRSMIENNFTEILDYPVYFRLNLALPNCSAGFMEKIIPYEPLRQRKSGGGGDGGDGNESEIMETSHLDVLLSTEGYLLWTDENNLKHAYDYEKYCIDQVNKTALIAVLCKPACTEDSPCVRKCCLPHEVLDSVNQTCVPSQSRWKPHLYHTSDFEPVTESEDTPSHIVTGVPQCENMYAVDMRTDSQKFYALLNGSLLTVEHNKKYVHPSNTFCIDGIVDEDSFLGSDYQPFNYYEGVRHSGLETDQIALICHPEAEETEENKWIYYLFATVMYISAMFLTLTAIVYLILWEYQNIHGWLQFSYVMSLLLAYVFLASVQIFANYIHKASSGICEFSGSLIHFSFLSAFFWLTSMNFDLWWTFSGFRPMIASTRTGEKKRFALFGLLSWGGASIITGTGVALDFNHKELDYIGEYLPRFGLNKCYFHNELSKLPFFYAPVAVLLCVNISFFLNTIYSLHKLQKDTRFATRQSSKQDKKRFVLFMKLFIVMGVCWIFEVISWLSILVYEKQAEPLKIAFLFTDTINALQGLFIFLIFTCKPNTCKQLEGQFKKLSARLEERRDKTRGSGEKSKIPRYIVIGFCAVLLPIVHGLRKLFNYCGRPARTLDGRRNTCQTTVVSTFDKSRKASDSSACTTLSVIDAGSYELDTTYK